MSTDLPVVEQFTVVQDPDDPTLVTIGWRVEAADSLRIEPLDDDSLPMEGSREFRITKLKTDFILTAKNKDGETVEKLVIKIDEKDLKDYLKIYKEEAEKEGGRKNWWQGTYIKVIILFLILIFISLFITWIL